jgi:transposase
VAQLSRIGIDTSKQIFQLLGGGRIGAVVLRRRLRRREVVELFGKLLPTVVGVEACGGAHYGARELTRLGHTVPLLASQYVKPCAMRGTPKRKFSSSNAAIGRQHAPSV